jgi:FtsH-binding integral membrane protein
MEARAATYEEAVGAYAVAGLGIFGAFTIYDFNRLRQGADGAVVIAASILLDVFNVFLLLLEPFDGRRQ